MARERPGIDGVRVAAILMILGAVWSIVQRRILGVWLTVDPPGPADYSAAGLQVIFGVALLQGSQVARKLVLWVAGVAAVALMLAVPFLATDPRLWLIGVALILGAAGLFGLLVGRGPSPALAVGSVLAIIAGWAGSAAGVLLVLGGPDRASLERIKEWATDDRSYQDDATGLSMALPEGWVALRSGNPLVPEEEAQIVLASTRVSAFALLARDDSAPAATLDRYLDTILKWRREEMPGVREETRVDVTLEKTPARKMWTAWTERRVRFRGSTTVWRDARRWFRLSAWFPAIQAPQAEKEVAALEKAVSFSSPLDASLKESLARVGDACPLLSPGAIKLLADSLPQDAPPEAYFRQGYEWAIKGLPLLDAEAAVELRSITQRVFGALPDQKRARLGTYIERLRFGPRTTPDDDRTMNELMAGAIVKLPEADQARLRELTERAIDVGRLR